MTVWFTETERGDWLLRALRLACAELQDLHAGFTDNRRADYEPPDARDVEWLVEKFVAAASSAGVSETGAET